MSLLNTWDGVVLVIIVLALSCGSAIYACLRILEIARYERIVKDGLGHNPPREKVIGAMNHAAYVMSIALAFIGFQLVFQLRHFTGVIIPHGWVGLFFFIISVMACVGWYFTSRFVARLIIKFFTRALWEQYELKPGPWSRYERFGNLVADPS